MAFRNADLDSEAGAARLPGSLALTINGAGSERTKHS